MGDIVDLTPTADVPHWTEFVAEEMAERGWTWDMLATLLMVERNKDEWGKIKLELDLWRVVGPTRKNIIFSEQFSAELGAIFGVSPQLFLNMHNSWMRRAQIATGALPPQEA